MELIRFYFVWKWGKKIPVEGSLMDQINTILIQNGIIETDLFKIRLFFKGKEIKKEFSLSYYNINNNSNIYIIEKKLLPKGRAQQFLNSLNKNKEIEKKTNFINPNNSLTENARISDRIFATWEMLQDSELFYLNMLKNRQVIENLNENETKYPTIITKSTEISTKPLPHCYSFDNLNEDKDIKKINKVDSLITPV